MPSASAESVSAREELDIMILVFYVCVEIMKTYDDAVSSLGLPRLTLLCSASVCDIKQRFSSRYFSNSAPLRGLRPEQRQIIYKLWYLRNSYLREGECMDKLFGEHAIIILLFTEKIDIQIKRLVDIEKQRFHFDIHIFVKHQLSIPQVQSQFFWFWMILISLKGIDGHFLLSLTLLSTHLHRDLFCFRQE